MRTNDLRADKPTERSDEQASPTDDSDDTIECPKCNEEWDAQGFANHLRNCAAPDITDFGGESA